MPDIDKDVMARRVEIATALREIVPGEGVITEEAGRRAYETDGLTAYKQLPMIVVLPETTEQVSQVLRYCNENKVFELCRAVPGRRFPAAHCRSRMACCLGWVNSIECLRSITTIAVRSYSRA